MKNKLFVFGTVIIVIIVCGISYYFYNMLHTNIPTYSDNIEQNELLNKEENVTENQENEQSEIKKKNIKIYSGNDRPIAIMTDNNVNAQPQSNINLAYIVYEIIVEGNETRLMPVFKGVPDDTILGPVRSVRHYFLDYMKENDAICGHLGQSPQAEMDIKILKMDDINGQIYDTMKARTETSLFWRSKERNAPHNAYTSIGSLRKIMEQEGYSKTSNKKSVLNYVEEEINLNGENDIIANSVTIPYASKHKVKYVYNDETKRYTRYSKGKLQKDKETGEDITVKNIIITFVYNYTIDDGEDKGRQSLNNVGVANGYYVTNGKAMRILCKKDSRTEQTVYTDDFGNEIDVNDGNTFINICPIDAEVTFE